MGAPTFQPALEMLAGHLPKKPCEERRHPWKRNRLARHIKASASALIVKCVNQPLNLPSVSAPSWERPHSQCSSNELTSQRNINAFNAGLRQLLHSGQYACAPSGNHPKYSLNKASKLCFALCAIAIVCCCDSRSELSPAAMLVITEIALTRI